LAVIFRALRLRLRKLLLEHLAREPFDRQISLELDHVILAAEESTR
jgi:hypothetical protein